MNSPLWYRIRGSVSGSALYSGRCLLGTPITWGPTVLCPARAANTVVQRSEEVRQACDGLSCRQAGVAALVLRLTVNILVPMAVGLGQDRRKAVELYWRKP